MLSQQFPQTHKRCGEPTNFVDKIAYQEKIHTIRANYELWEKRIDEINAGRAVLSVRVWTGKPYRSKQREVFAFEGVGIERMLLGQVEDGTMYHVAEKDNSLTYIRTPLVASNDGLSVEDFKEWFKDVDRTKPMAIIHFSNYRYS